MRSRPAALALAVLAVLAVSHGILAQTVGSQGAAKASVTDLTGVWRRSRRPPDNARRYTVFELAYSLTVDEPPMTPWAEEKFNAARPSIGPHEVPLSKSNDPVSKCFPPGVPRIYLQRGLPMEIMQIPGRVVMLFEYDHFVRQIFTDGRQHVQDMPPSWMGDSIGKWEGNTLVVDTTGFNDKTWLDLVGHPHTDALHLVERLRRVSHDTMTIDISIDDPKAYTRPWVSHSVYELKPEWTIGEVICEDDAGFTCMEKMLEPGK